MTIFHIGAILLAGMGAGAINTLVGSGTLITFPTLLAFGIPPVSANVSNTIGLVPGSVAGTLGYRRELTGQRHRIVWLASASFLGGLLGAVLLLALPARAFSAIVPALILLGLALVVFQNPIQARVAARHEHLGGLPDRGAVWVWPGILLCGVYGGYFGAAQGVLLMAVMGIGIPDSLQRLNGLKNLLASIVNGLAGLVFAFVADVRWEIALIIATGAIIGAQLASRVGRRLPDRALRAVIVVVGVVALVAFVSRS